MTMARTLQERRELAEGKQAPWFYSTEHWNLSLVTYNQHMHDTGANFWYAVRCQEMAHAAFRTRAGLRRWMNDRGIRFTQDIPSEGTFSYQRLEGRYRSTSWVSTAHFNALAGSDFARDHGLQTKVLSKGNYTLGLIFQDEDMVHNVNFLNPNVIGGVVYDYRKSVAEMS